MQLYQALILGLVQGLTEFLPISSSAHLSIIPQIFKWSIPASFDVALHFGTLLAIAVFFFKEWLALLKGGYRKFIKKDDNFEGKMLFYILVATLPGGIIGFVLDKLAQDLLSKPIIIAVALIVMGIALYFIDKYSANEYEYKDLGIKQTFVVGLSQALAFIPGVSRSGITMTAARMQGIKREAAARLSFMLSAPIILGASIYKFLDFQFSLEAVVGILASFVVGLMVIKFLLDYLKNKSYKVFAIYRIMVGIFIIGLCILGKV